MNLRDATNKVSAEALRQFHIDAAEERRKAEEAALDAEGKTKPGEGTGEGAGEGADDAAAESVTDSTQRVPTPPEKPKEGSRPSSRKVKSPTAAQSMASDDSTGNNKAEVNEPKSEDKTSEEDKVSGDMSEGGDKLTTDAAEENTTAEPTGADESASPSGETAEEPEAATEPAKHVVEEVQEEVIVTASAEEVSSAAPADDDDTSSIKNERAQTASNGKENVDGIDEEGTGDSADGGKDGLSEGETMKTGTEEGKVSPSEYETDTGDEGDATDAPRRRRKTKTGEQKSTEKVKDSGADKGTVGDEAVGDEAAGLSDAGDKSPDTKSAMELKYPDIEYNPDEDEEPGPDPNFFYDLESLYARAKTSEGADAIPPNFLTLFHSFGYECLKRCNLHVLDEKNVLFSAGNYIQILNLETKKLTYLPTIGGRGIGSIAVHPSKKYFAVGERGYEPDILIFEYPSLKLYRICRKGTETAYAFLSFSPEGDKLASLGSTPDYMLTIWDWKREKIILRSKAHGQDVFRVSFSTEIEGQLTTGGLAHIKFWKMAATFTGLKLQGELGKFGRTPISDIEGYVELPDGKVLSGSEWGNMLLWDGDLIKCELTQHEKKNCHNGMIQEIFLDEGELITAGADGAVKIWDFETIDGADVLEEDAHFPMEPMSEVFVGDGVNIISMCKTVTENNNDTNSMWLAQDASGGIWKLDISVSLTKKAPELIQSYHAGPICNVAACPYTHMVSSIGADGAVRVYDYLRKRDLVVKKYKSGGSCIMWPGRNVDSKMVTLIGGFTDGVVRVMCLDQAEQESQYDLKIVLQHVFKPHKGEVTAMVVDDEGRTLITGSKDDSTLFFFDIKSNYMPIGFLKLDSAVSTMAWSNSSKRVLVGLNSGLIQEVECPDPGLVDSSVTYEIPSGNLIKQFPFKSVRYKLEKAAYEQIQMKQEESQKKRLEKIKEELGEEAYLEEKKVVDDEKKKQVERVFEAPAAPNQILKILPLGDKFYVSLDGSDAGALYECTFNDPLEGLAPPVSRRGEWVRQHGEPLRVIDLDTDTTVHQITIMGDDSNVMLGMGDGTIRIHKKLEGEGLQIGPPYTLPAHSENVVGGIISSHDTRFLISGGNDGNLFIYKVNHAGVELSLPSPTDQLLKSRTNNEKLAQSVDDIDDLKAYSIEEAKQKHEYEKMLKTAEDKKIRVRKTVATLRSKFKKIKAKNKELPEHLRLIPDDFEMDPDMQSNIAHEVREMKELLQKQLAWNSEKHRLQLAKLRKRFKDVIATDRIVLHAVESEHTVATFRCAKPSEAMKKALDDFKKKLADENTVPGSRGSDTRRISMALRGGVGFLRKQTELDLHGSVAGAAGTTKGSKKLKDAKANKSLQKAEERKAKRLAREATWKNLYARKPSENYEDPTMLAAIEDAKENMGDFNLKTAKNYKVPESQRQGATFKRTQLLELRRMIYTTKMNFNERLLSLRDKKKAMIEEAKLWEARLNEIQGSLSPDQILLKPRVPVLLNDEVPERLMEYTPESLRAFKEKYDKQQKQGADDGGGFGGFGGFGGSDNPTPQPAADTKPAAHVKPAPSVSSVPVSDVKTTETGEGDVSTVMESPVSDVKVSLIETECEELKLMMILHEQQCLIDQMNEAYKEFDDKLLKLRSDKIELDVQLKNGDLRLILLFEELLLLKEFEKRENFLKEALSSKLSDRDEMSDKIEELQEKLGAKKMYMEEMQENEKMLYESFHEQLGENNKFVDFLTKVFKKKIKRVKKSAEVEGDSDESDSDDDYDLSSEEEDDDEEGEHLDLNVCPAGCPPEMYDSTIILREKKLDLEEAIMEEKKMIDTLKKEVDALVKKNKIINHGVKGAKNDLEAFQLEKQKKMNELDMIVTLNLDQIQYMSNGVLPSDLTTCLVFHSGGVNNLSTRIKELQHEKAQQIKKFKELKKSHIQLIKGKKNMSEKLVALEEKCQNMMLLKFGREVDLNKLENISTNRIGEELKETIAKKDVKYSRKLNEWEVQINQSKQRLLTATREHTSRLDTLNELTKEKQDLEALLDSKQKNLGGEYSGQRKADLKERQRLLQLVQLQAQEIDALKDEIGILSRKDGHILPPTQTSVPPLPPINAGGR